MSYVDSSLMQGEKVMHRAHLHKIMFVWPGLIAVISIIAGLWVLVHPAYHIGIAGACFLIAAGCLLSPYIHYKTSEFAVTNKRVIVKIGLIQRQTLETLLQKIEAIAVDQTILGRMFNYGTITITGTGGTRESFYNIADPLTFRRSVQEQTDILAKTI